MCLHPGAGFLIQSLLQANTNNMINKAKNVFFIAFLASYFLSLYEIELQEEHF